MSNWGTLVLNDTNEFSKCTLPQPQLSLETEVKGWYGWKTHQRRQSLDPPGLELIKAMFFQIKAQMIDLFFLNSYVILTISLNWRWCCHFQSKIHWS